MVIKTHKCPAYAQLPKKTPKILSFGIELWLQKNQIPDPPPPPSAPNISLNFLKYLPLWRFLESDFFNTQNQWVLQESNTHPHTSLYFSSPTDIGNPIGNTDGLCSFFMYRVMAVLEARPSMFWGPTHHKGQVVAWAMGQKILEESERGVMNGNSFFHSSQQIGKKTWQQKKIRAGNLTHL
jgi:hypothetical protein